ARDEEAQLRETPAQQIAVFLQETLDLRRLAIAQSDDLVVQLDRLDRLDVDGGAAAGDAMDDPHQRALGFGADRDDVPVAPEGDESILQRPRHLGPGDDVVESVLETFVAPADLLPDRVELV